MRPFLDTNVLLYAFTVNPADLEKQDGARALLVDGNCILSVQVLNEFVWQATRKGTSHGISTRILTSLVEEFSQFEIVDLNMAVFKGAWDIRNRTNYSWWDCLIVAAARQARCDVLYTEDMHHGHLIDGVRIENPFRDLD